ncbi:hypothetical protein [Stenotrophomonas indicatrix]
MLLTLWGMLLKGGGPSRYLVEYLSFIDAAERGTRPDRKHAHN